MATSAPVPMAIPTSAWASAGASLIAVADHRDHPAAALEPGHDGGLVGRLDVGQHPVGRDPALAGHGLGGRPAVAGHEPRLDAGRLEPVRRPPRSRP